jgi:hypothetical protein
VRIHTKECRYLKITCVSILASGLGYTDHCFSFARPFITVLIPATDVKHNGQNTRYQLTINLQKVLSENGAGVAQSI